MCGVGRGPVLRLITADLTVEVAAEVFTLPRLRWLGGDERCLSLGKVALIRMWGSCPATFG